jgi:hypothetical protein
VTLSTAQENSVAGSTHESSEDRLEKLYSDLDKEQDQENSYPDADFDLNAIDTAVLREREREYIDVEKHWVRVNGWKQIAATILKQKQKLVPGTLGLRYFTLPAYYRLDVSLLHREALLEVTERDVHGEAAEIYVAGFEVEPTKFGRMQGQRPRLKLLARTTVENALVDSKDPYFRQVRNLFPFDMVNLDLTTSLTPRHEGPYSKTMQAIETVLSLQSGMATPWALFLTFRNLPSDWEENARLQLTSNLQDNLDSFPAVQEAFYDAYRCVRVSEYEEEKTEDCISQSVAKWITDRAHQQQFTLQTFRTYRYTRENPGVEPYSIYKQTYIFGPGQIHPARIPTKGMPQQSWMTNDLVRCISDHKPRDVAGEIRALTSRGQTVVENLKGDIAELCALIT